MTVFAYAARDQTGRRVDGRLEAGSREAVVLDLQGRGLVPIRVREAIQVRPRRKRVPVRRLARAYIQLSDLLKAGVPILRSLELLGRGKADPRLAVAMSRVAERVSDGERFADAMQTMPEAFPPVHVAMVQAGERGGFLKEVLAELGEFLEHQADRKSTVIGNLIYPAILVLVGVSIIVTAMIFFVPKFQAYFEGMELPLATRILLGMSAFLTTWWPLILGMLVALVVSWFFVRRLPSVQRRLAMFQLRAPIAGALARSLAVARFTRILGTLIGNGIPMLAAMRISRDSAGNILLIEAIDEATDAVGAGESLAQPLGASGLFDEDVVEMISVGESSNTLPTVLVGVAETAERRTDRVLANMLKLMEPVLLVVLAAAVMFVFLALVVPMMQLGTQMG
ncbi:MAG: type II secretion system F family protein [Phycisphaerales bacterium]|nr:type II secretion system F family protein [Phycisphaerales bacterium]